MKKLLITTTLAFGAGASTVLAANLDRSGQTIKQIFEPGGYAEFSYNGISPDVSGVDAFGSNTGNVGNDYEGSRAAFKYDINNQFGFAFLIDQPYGADIKYSYDAAPTAPVALFDGLEAEVRSLSVRAIGIYRIDDNFSVYGGLNAQRLSADVKLSGAAYGGLNGYDFDIDDEWGTGFLVGAAYERKDIALRVSLTYHSEIDYDFDSAENFFGNTETDVTTPESVNLEFQTGIAADTLVFGSIRWVGWDGFNVTPPGLNAASVTPENPMGGNLVSYDDDTVTYELGIGRKFTEQISGAATIGWEPRSGGTGRALGPTDGYVAYGVGGSYLLSNGIKLAAGIRYLQVGDTDVQSGGGTGNFEDNDVLGGGMTISYAF